MLYLPPLASCIFNNMLQRNRTKSRYVSQEKVIFCNTNLWPSGCPCCKIAPAAQKLAAHPMWQRWAASHNSRCCIRHQPGERGGSHCWWEDWRLLNRPDWPLQFNLSVSREALMWMQVHMFKVSTRNTSWAKATCAQCAGKGGINGLSIAGGCLVAELRQRWR